MFIDSHCHLNFTCFKQQRESLLQSLQQANINKLIIPATHENEWKSIISLAEKHANI